MPGESQLLDLLAVSDAVKTSLIVLIGGPLCALAVGWQLNRQNRASKAEDYARQDAVAAAAKKVADDQLRQQREVATTAQEAAKLLFDAQAATTASTEEVARVAADKSEGGARRSRLLAVVISHPSGYRREVQLDAVPAVGEHILLRNMPADSQPSLVADVLWVEANGEPRPSVVIVVRSLEDDPGKGLMKAAADAE